MSLEGIYFSTDADREAIYLNLWIDDQNRIGVHLKYTVNCNHWLYTAGLTWGTPIRWAEAERSGVPAGLADELAHSLRVALLRLEQKQKIPLGSLPRFEGGLDFIRRYNDPEFLAELAGLMELLK